MGEEGLLVNELFFQTRLIFPVVLSLVNFFFLHRVIDCSSEMSIICSLLHLANI